MRNTDYFKNKKITVVGLARSGLSCANLLFDLGAKVSITDNQDNGLTRLNAAKLKSTLRPPRAKARGLLRVILSGVSESNVSTLLELGKHTREFIKGRDLIVVSPGIRDDALPVIWAKQFNIPVVSEIEIASILCPATVVAVTGSNGKTTVTTLIGKIIEAAGKKVFVCGNIGSPFSGEVNKIKKDDFVSLEVSSFQLEKIQTFKPKIAVILNFSRNHLDRYKNMQEYLDAKKRIFMNQDESDYLVLNNDEPVVRELSKETKAKVIYFREGEDLNPNQAAVLTVGSILGINRELCLEVFKEFRGIEHRLECVAQINNIKFINDSKSTTVESTLWALKNISSPIVLIAGGRDKGNDYSPLIDLLRDKVKELILIGEAKKKMEGALSGILSIEEASGLDEAVNIAFSKAKAGDCVLLSPMCSSFDMFSNYEERGKVFKKAVNDLTKRNTISV